MSNISGQDQQELPLIKEATLELGREVEEVEEAEEAEAAAETSLAKEEQPRLPQEQQASKQESASLSSTSSLLTSSIGTPPYSSSSSASLVSIEPNSLGRDPAGGSRMSSSTMLSSVSSSSASSAASSQPPPQFVGLATAVESLPPQQQQQQQQQRQQQETASLSHDESLSTLLMQCAAGTALSPLDDATRPDEEQAQADIEHIGPGDAAIELAAQQSPSSQHFGELASSVEQQRGLDAQLEATSLASAAAATAQGDTMGFKDAASIGNRAERGDSCSHEERGTLTRSYAIAAEAAHLLTSAAAESNSSSNVLSASHDNIAAASASHSLLVEPNDVHQPQELVDSLNLSSNCSISRLSSISYSPPRHSSVQLESSITTTTTTTTRKPTTQAAPQKPNANASQPASSNSSRFFSSKLNTGSLWSLLSVGSSTSMNAINEISSSSEQQQQADRQQIEMSSGDLGATNKQQQLRDFTARSASNFFNQFKPKLQTPAVHPAMSSSHSFDQSGQISSQERASKTTRYRFGIKYIGSAMLHKNFTLPMLEWIAKDIKRQTSRSSSGAGFNQRQFTFPIRDIIFEIQSNQLVAISCKDGHCIFVHPMHCVSKYAQLQHDPSSFAYIIRDSKDAPSFCHVFQAKSANKVHDLFSAIREVTTRQQLTPSISNQLQMDPQQHLSSANRLQKSASTDGHWRSLLGAAPAAADPAAAMSKSPPTSASVGANGVPMDNPILATYNKQQQQQQQQLQVSQQQTGAASVQFENSYQFEVMFVKRVKLQCRRVPPSFVEDALETLKTFEAPKTTQIKTVVSKRIISASVDERQEYEACQSPTPAEPQLKATHTSQNAQYSHAQAQESSQAQALNLQEHQTRRGSSVSLSGDCDQQQGGGCGGGGRLSPRSRESKSCQQSPAKQQAPPKPSLVNEHTDESIIRSKIKVAGPPPSYTNDFSPYNTITSSDLNERIAAIPVVSSSVSLDHETRQKLARQVRETIMATAANIKKDVYASGDKLHSSSSSKALDSLSCTKTENLLISRDPAQEEQEEEQEEREQQQAPQAQTQPQTQAQEVISEDSNSDHQSRRFSAHAASLSLAQKLMNHPNQPQQQSAAAAANNFDLFRRASSRQVVKNRTMLLLIGKDELCAISIDKHQMLFSKSFNSLVHCLSGIKNRDHFGLICRESGKINPQAESYAGFVFKCQSEKVVREIMGALKQVIYSSQHNYHGYNSPYNPLNSSQLASIQSQFNSASAPTSKQPQQQQQQQQKSPKQALQQLGAASTESTNLALAALENSAIADKNQLITQSEDLQPTSLVSKRGFVSQPLELEEAKRQQQLPNPNQKAPTTAPALQTHHHHHHQLAPTKNPIKSMFCDDCPLYWFHRLCCDIESLPGEASKAIILRRIDSSLSEREQDEIFTKFSDFQIESIDEHNEIFMSLLRHLSERKQLRHNQTPAHLKALAKNASLAKKHSSDLINLKQQQHAVSTLLSGQGQMSEPPSGLVTTSSNSGPESRAASSPVGGQSALANNRTHQRSGSSSGALAFVIGSQQLQSQPTTTTSLVDASSVAIDNLKRAKNSISVSIENMLKRRSSLRDGEEEHQEPLNGSAPASSDAPQRAGSFKASSREARSQQANDQQELTQDQQQLAGSSTSLKRSQSTSDYPAAQQQLQTRIPAASWRDSLTRTLNTDDLTSPFVGFFKRRGSFVQSEAGELDFEQQQQRKLDSKRTSTESLQSNSCQSPLRGGAGVGGQRLGVFGGAGSSHSQGQNYATPTSLLSGSFWKKSIFDKIQKTSPTQKVESSESARARAEDPQEPSGEPRRRRSKEELRKLWHKAIREQITLLKMDKQNQKLLSQASSNKANSSGPPVPQAESSKTPATTTNENTDSVERIKLNYRDVPPGKEAMPLWDRLLRQDPTRKVQFVEVARLVRLGVPKERRGEVWMFLMNQYQLRHGTSFQPEADSEFKGDANQTYRSLLSQLSTQQHEIFVDIGRTFPSHPYYSQYLSIGQLSLFNLLKAYSLLDRQVGYCQGLSFVAGTLLLHVDSEDEAFELMRHLMFNFGLRKQYLPSMDALHLQLYQMTRLLRDHDYEIFDHFDKHDISPSLYAAPWFLTLFASQFSLGFVARLLDLIYLIGIEAIFRVSLNLLTYHRASIMNCTSLELTMDFMRTGLVKVDDKNLVKIFDEALSLDLRNKLIEYEIEYSFYCAEDKTRTSSNSHYHHHTHHHHGLSARHSANSSSSTVNQDLARRYNKDQEPTQNQEEDKTITTSTGGGLTSEVADATATVIIQHLLSNNHLRSLRSNYSY